MSKVLEVPRKTCRSDAASIVGSPSESMADSTCGALETPISVLYIYEPRSGFVESAIALESSNYSCFQ